VLPKRNSIWVIMSRRCFSKSEGQASVETSASREQLSLLYKEDVALKAFVCSRDLSHTSAMSLPE
jgi:hypothetical protein